MFQTTQIDDDVCRRQHHDVRQSGINREPQSHNSPGKPAHISNQWYISYGEKSWTCSNGFSLTSSAFRDVSCDEWRSEIFGMVKEDHDGVSLMSSSGNIFRLWCSFSIQDPPGIEVLINLYNLDLVV